MWPWENVVLIGKFLKLGERWIAAADLCTVFFDALCNEICVKQQTSIFEIQKSWFACVFWVFVVLSADPRNFQKLQVLEIHSMWMIGNCELLSILQFIDILLLKLTILPIWHFEQDLDSIFFRIHLSSFHKFRQKSSLSIPAWWRTHSKTFLLWGKWDAKCRPELVSSKHVTSFKGRDDQVIGIG